MCTYSYMYKYIYIHIYVYIILYKYVYIHIYMFVYLKVYTYSWAAELALPFVNIYTLVNIHRYTYIHTCIYMHIYTLLYNDIYIEGTRRHPSQTTRCYRKICDKRNKPQFIGWTFFLVCRILKLHIRTPYILYSTNIRALYSTNENKPIGALCSRTNHQERCI